MAATGVKPACLNPMDPPPLPGLSPTIDVDPRPQSAPGEPGVNDGLGEVGISVHIGRDAVSVAQSQAVRDCVRVDQVIHVHLAGHLG